MLPFSEPLSNQTAKEVTAQVNKAMHDAGRRRAGDTVTVEIRGPGEEPETRCNGAAQSPCGRPPAQALWADITPWRARTGFYG